MIAPFTKISWSLAASWAVLSFTTAVNAQMTTSSNCSTQLFPQLIDHGNSSSSNATFLQRYQVNSTHFKPGGPIFYYQQAETAIFACLEDLILPEWAAELGALVITLEHRFFGLSSPSNATNPIEKYKSLTLENVMLDAVTFVEHMKRTVPGAKDSKVIVTGGSYAAFLTTVLKTNYPDVFYAAIPWAAPLRAIGANYQNPDRYEWFKWADKIYWDLSATAASKMKKAINALHKRFQTTTNTTSIAKDFNLCAVPASGADLSALMAFINTATYLIPQGGYNNPVANPARATAQKLVSLVEKLDDPMEIINATFNVYYPSSIYPCVPFDPSQSGNPTLQKEPFNYLVCKYFPLSSNEVPEGTMFIPTSTQTESDPTTCETMFNLVPPTQEYVQAKYHFSRADLIEAKRIIFAYNEFDPTTAVGLEPIPLTQDRNASRWMYTNLAAHGEESIASYPGDSANVIHAREVQLQGIKEWFGWF
ncbi:peptidase S28 [Xylogone sp. PMI_703]|nr:peptidase S28 [Xylogone sp. PMI_703]